MAFWNRNSSLVEHSQALKDLRSELEQGLGRLQVQLQQQHSSLEDIRLASGSKDPVPSHVQTAIRSFRRQSPGTLNWQTARGLFDASGNMGDYQGPVHNLAEISKAVDVESYFARAVQRHVVLCMKNGYRIVGRDNERARYITRRLNEIMLVSGTTLSQILREAFTNLVTYSNHFVVMKRDPLRSSGRKIRLHGKSHDPISGLYPADPTTMAVKQSSSGLIERWRQSMGQHGLSLTANQQNKFFRPSDVIHLFLDRKTGFVFGTPYVIPVLDDMRLLRRLEELADIISHKHAFPLLVVKVGTEDRPADEVMLPGGQTVPEVDIAEQKIEELDFEGGIVVTERYDIQFIGAENKALDLKPYLEHLELRVLGGLRLSEIDLGRGDSANRNTAQTISQNLIDTCTDMQRVVEDVITWNLFFPLLMEGGYSVDLSRPEEEMVYLDFAPIDTTEQRAQEVHALEQYQGNLITETEARGCCGRQPIGDSDREDLMLNRVSKPTSDMEAKAKATVAASKATTTSKSRPTNQHGTKPKPKVSKNQLVRYEGLYTDQVAYHFKGAAEAFLDGIDLLPGKDPYIGEEWKKTAKPKYVRTMGTRAGYQTARLIHYLRAAEAGILMEARTYLTPLVELGFDTAIGPEDPEKTYISRDEMDIFFRVWVRGSMKETLKSSVDVMRLWGGGQRAGSLSFRSKLEVHGLDVADCASRQAKLAYAYGFKLGAKALGKDAILVTHADGARCPRSGQKLVPVDTDLGRLVCIRRGCRMEYSVAGQ